MTNARSLPPCRLTVGRAPLSAPTAFPLAVLVLAVFVLAAVAAPAAAAPPQEADQPAAAAPQEGESADAPAADPYAGELERAQATMGSLLEVGRALHAWARDTRLERGRRQPVARLPKQVRWGRCPGIGHAELEALLVPAYLSEIPAEDAWERPLQFCLDRRLSGNEQQYGVRSAGSDGEYSDDPYRVGGFPETRLEGDLVWMDGYFIRWPEPQ